MAVQINITPYENYADIWLGGLDDSCSWTDRIMCINVQKTGGGYDQSRETQLAAHIRSTAKVRFSGLSPNGATYYVTVEVYRTSSQETVYEGSASFATNNSFRLAY